MFMRNVNHCLIGEKFVVIAVATHLNLITIFREEYDLFVAENDEMI